MNTVQIRGVVTRKPHVQSNFAAFSVRPDKVKSDDRTSILDVVVFDAGPIAVAGMLEEGAKVQIVGHLGAKKHQGKDKRDTQIDGRDLWVMQLVADDIDAADDATAKNVADDDPF